MHRKLAVAIVAAIFLATPALAAGDAIPGQSPAAAKTEPFKGPLHKYRDRTMPAFLDLFARAGVLVQTGVMAVGITVFEAPLNPRSAGVAYAKHLGPRIEYVFGEPLGSH